MRFSIASTAGFDVCCLHVEQLPCLRDVVGATAVGEEAVVADEGAQLNGALPALTG